MKIQSLSDWFDDLPEEVKDKLSELVYDRDIDILEERMNDFIMKSVRFTFESSKTSENTLKMPQKAYIREDLTTKPITEQEIQNLRKLLDEKFND